MGVKASSISVAKPDKWSIKFADMVVRPFVDVSRISEDFVGANRERESRRRRADEPMIELRAQTKEQNRLLKELFAKES